MLFNRVTELTIGVEGGKGKSLDNLKFSFSIEKGSTRTPNNCTCEVYNCSETTNELLCTVGAVLILKAGYENSEGATTIFTGEVKRGIRKRSGADWITSLELSDGFYEFRDTKISVSYGPVNGLIVVKNLASQFNLPVKPLPKDITDKYYPNGFSYVGKLREAMTEACNFMGLDWSIQNRQIQISKKGQAYKTKAIVLSSDSGLIGSPEPEKKTMTEKLAAKEGIYFGQPGVLRTYKVDKNGKKTSRLEVLGLKVTSLLQPTLEPGGLVQLDTKSFKKQFFRIESLIHTGGKFENEFYTELTLRYV